MTRLTALLALVLAASTAPAAQTDAPVHTFQVFEGRVFLDGRPLPDAVPDGLDLGDMMTPPLEFSGAVAPVLEVDGRAYVLEDDRLVPLDESSRAGQSVYILGEPMPDAEDVAAMPMERVRPIVDAAYLRDVADRDGALFGQMQRERELEAEIFAAVARVLALPAGAERDALRSDLQDRLSALLALKHDNRAAELDHAEAQLEAARRSLDARRQQHDAIVEGRLRELVGE